MAFADLLPIQQEFVRQFLIDLNQTQAYIRAGYSPEGARGNASRLIANDNIQAAIMEMQEKRNRRTEVTAERVVKELARVGFASMRSFMKWGPDGIELRPCDEVDEDDTAAVAELTQTTSKDGGSIKFKLHNKLDALGKLMPHVGLTKEPTPLVDLIKRLADLDPEIAAELGKHLAEGAARKRLADSAASVAAESE